MNHSFLLSAGFCFLQYLSSLTFIAGVVKVYKILFPVGRKALGVDSITMILASDVAPASGEIQSWNIVSSVAVFQFDGTCTSCEGKQLMSQADSHNRNLRRFHQLAEMIDSFLAVSRITGSVGALSKTLVPFILFDLKDGAYMKTPSK